MNRFGLSSTYNVDEWNNKLEYVVKKGDSLYKISKEYGVSINDLINAEADSTKVSLVDYSRPTLTISIEKIDEYNKFKSIIQNRTTLPIDNTKPFTEREYNKLITQFTPRKRTKMKLPQLDNYCIFLASKYFAKIDDHINLTKVCKRLKYNMDKLLKDLMERWMMVMEYQIYLKLLEYCQHKKI